MRVYIIYILLWFPTQLIHNCRKEMEEWNESKLTTFCKAQTERSNFMYWCKKYFRCFLVWSNPPFPLRLSQFLCRLAPGTLPDGTLDHLASPSLFPLCALIFERFLVKWLRTYTQSYFQLQLGGLHAYRLNSEKSYH